MCQPLEAGLLVCFQESSRLVMLAASGVELGRKLRASHARRGLLNSAGEFLHGAHSGHAATSAGRTLAGMLSSTWRSASP